MLYMRPQLLEVVVGFGQVFAVGAVSLKEVGHGIQAKAVHPKVDPEVDDLEDFFLHRRVVVVEVRLVSIKAVPIVGLGHGVPGPVGGLEVLKDDAYVLVLVWGIAPDIVVAVLGAGGA